ncbi:lysozyme family protein [Bacillus mycoides]|uniref:bifunctional lytic transglycosylase/C40 family peptidase n=2 Tax=Bacillus mycoides TaxID=1405 RepID=UPI003D1DA26B
MIRKKTSDQSNSNFRQQESAMREVDKNVKTAEQKSSSQAKNVIESSQQDTDQGELQKQTSKLFQQQESAVQVVDRKYEITEKKQFSQTTSTIESPQQETGQEKLQKQFSKLSQHTNQEFQQKESAVHVVDKNCETAEQKQFSQTISTIESPQQETGQEKLQKQSFKLSQHTTQEFQQQESAVHVVDKKYETAEQKQYSQTTSTIESPQQDTGQEKLQKQSSKLFQHTTQEFQQPESTAKVLNKTFKTAEQKQFSQTTSTIESPQQETDQGKLQKQSFKLSQHTTQEFHQPESTVKALNKKQETAEQKQFSQTINATESPPEKRQGKLQKQSSKVLQHSNQEFQQKEGTVQVVDKKYETAKQKQFSQATSIIESHQQDTGQEKLQKQSSKQSQHMNQKMKQQGLIKDVKKPEALKTSQQKQVSQTEKSILKENEKKSKKLFNDNPKVQKGIQFIGKLGKNSLIATKAEVKKSLIDAKNSLKYGAKTSAKTTKDSVKGGIKKYQKALEQGDDGVKVASQGVTKGYRLTRKGFGLAKKGFRKLRERKQEKLYIKTLDKGEIESLKKLKQLDKKTSVKKLTKVTAKKLTKVTTNVAGSSALKYQKALEQGDDGVKIASQSATKIARATKKLVKNRIKANTKLGKMGKQKGKLIPFSKDKKLKIDSRNILKKKAMKKKMYYTPLRDKNKARALTSIASNVKDRIANLFKSLGKFNLQNIKKMIGTKVAAIAGGGFASALPIIMVGIILLFIAGMLGAGSKSQEQVSGNIGASKNLSPEVEKWRGLVEKEAAAQGMQDFVNLLLAIIQIESGGRGTPDIMQSSESAGYDRPNVFQTEEESVRQGVKHLKECLLALKAFNMGYENNVKALAQAYNYGNYFATWLGKRGGEYNLEVAEEYSRTIVAPSLGNTTGRTMSYVNETSLRLGKPYKYINGGNFFYGELISEYIGGSGANISGDFRKVLDEIEKYQGWEYVWGGKNPTQGFDCSGLTSWGLKQIGIDLPSYALSQYELTEPIDPSQAQPGDLIFFKGTYQSPDHISHVGFYIDENTMYDSQNAGIGYHNWKTSYWQQYFAGIQRVKR